MTAAPAAVTMYTTTWCGYCFRLKKLMQRAGATRGLRTAPAPNAAASATS